eukprot:3931880-Rhodomonas_salina.1
MSAGRVHPRPVAPAPGHKGLELTRGDLAECPQAARCLVQQLASGSWSLVDLGQLMEKGAGVSTAPHGLAGSCTRRHPQRRWRLALQPASSTLRPPGSWNPWRAFAAPPSQIVQPYRLAFLEGPDPDCWRLEVPSQERAFKPTVRVGRVLHLWMFPWEFSDDVTAKGVQVSMERRAEAVSLQKSPWRCVSLCRPVIVDTAELDDGPGPESVGHVGSLHHASNMFLCDADGSFDTSLHCVVVPSRGTHGDASCITPHLEALTPGHGAVEVHSDGGDLDLRLTDECLQQGLRIGLVLRRWGPDEVDAVDHDHQVIAFLVVA